MSLTLEICNSFLKHKNGYYCLLTVLNDLILMSNRRYWHTGKTICIYSQRMLVNQENEISGNILSLSLVLQHQLLDHAIH